MRKPVFLPLLHLVCFAAAIFSALVATTCNAGAWRVAAPPLTAASDTTLTRLKDGRVLRTGGRPNDCICVSAKAEIFDPETGKWSTAGEMSQARHLHAAILLQSGEVMVTGGIVGPNTSESSRITEIFDPATMRWRTSGNSLVGRYYHTLSLLPDGRVLAVGSELPGISSTEIFDPATGLWGSAGALSQQRYLHTATSLRNGDVLIVGGDSRYTDASAIELYVAATQTWRTVTSLGLRRYAHAAVLAGDGTVLVTGGRYGLSAATDALRYDPVQVRLIDAPRPSSHRTFHQMIALPTPSGEITLSVGGNEPTPIVDSVPDVESIRLGDEQWQAESPLNRTSGKVSLALLNGSRVLAVGYDTAEIFDFTASQTSLGVDASYGVVGRANTSFDSKAQTVAVDPVLHPQTNSVLIVSACGSSAGGQCAALIDRDGQLIQSFGNAGIAGSFPITVRSTAFQTDGRILLAGFCPGGTPNYNWCVARLTAAGQLDASYGNGGVAVADGLRSGAVLQLLQLPSAGVLAVGNCPGAVASTQTLCSAKLSAAGTLDKAHLGAATSLPSPFRTISWPYGSVLTADGGYVVNAVCSATHPNPSYVVYAEAPCVAKFLENGALDTTFGTNGFAIANFAAGHGSLTGLTGNSRTQMTVSADGSITAVFGCRQDYYAVWEDCIAKWQSDGRPVAGFGVNGIVTLPGQGGCKQSNVTRMAGYPDGRLVLLATCSGALGIDYSGQRQGQRAKRLMIVQPNGVVNPDISGLIATSFSDSEPFNVDTAALFVRSDGMITVVGSGQNSSYGGKNVLSFRLIGAPSAVKPVQMIEYRYAPLNYYFMTSRSTEQQLLDATAGWSRTGEAFTVSGSLAQGTRPLTRFYFDSVAAGGKRGSHFYTTLGSEVGVVQSLNPLNEPIRAKPFNEGISGFAFNLTATGDCPAYTVPVYRAFRGNPRFPDDPNHRFTARRDLYDTLVRQGWDGEGVKFCALKVM